MKTKPSRFPEALRARRHLAKVDSKLGRVIDEVGPLKIELDPGETIYESLGISIVYQQLHGKAAASITKRLKALFNDEDRFPEPAEIAGASLTHLKSAGLSESKAKALQDLAEKTIQRVLPDRAQAAKMNDEELIEALTAVKGIGPWTAQMLLIFTLGRKDVLPVADYGVRKGFSLLYGKKDLPTPRELLAFGERWKPYRSAAAWYLWRVTEMPRFKK